MAISSGWKVSINSRVRSKMIFNLRYGSSYFLSKQFVHLQELHFLVYHLDQAKAHDGGSRIYSQYNFFGSQMLCLVGVEHNWDTKFRFYGNAPF